MKKYKVLMVADLGNEWNSGRWKKEGFIKNGHELIIFDPGIDNKPGQKIMDIVKEAKPDFLVHYKNELPSEAFQDLRAHTRVIMWYPDPVIPEWLPPYLRSADIVFTMTEGLVEEFRMHNPKSFWLTEAFEPSYFNIGNITDRDLQEYSADVTFIGNLGSKPQYLPRRRFLNAVIKNGFNFKWWGPRLPRKFSTALLVMGRLGRAYGGRFVWGEDHAKIAQLSKIYLGFDSMPQIRKSMSERLYIAVGCGAFYMCQHVDGIEEVLLPDKEIVTFKDEGEMIDKIRFYLKNDGTRTKIAEAGRERVLKEHTYQKRVQEMFEIVDSDLDEL